MSLVAFAVRIAAVRAIPAALWPQVEVLDSPMAPLVTIERRAVPLVALYTGRDSDRMDGRDMLGGEPRLSLSVQIFLPPLVKIGALELDTTGEGADTVLDVMSRRITTAFLAAREPWAELFLDLVQKTRRTVESSYLVQTEKVRIAARELTFECDTIHEPLPGAAPTDVWSALVALMRTDVSPRSVAPLADWIAAEIAGPQTLSQAERDRIDLGLSAYAAGAVRITPSNDADDLNAFNLAPDSIVDTFDVSADPAAPPPDGSEIDG